MFQLSDVEEPALPSVLGKDSLAHHGTAWQLTAVIMVGEMLGESAYAIRYRLRRKTKQRTAILAVPAEGDRTAVPTARPALPTGHRL